MKQKAEGACCLLPTESCEIIVRQQRPGIDRVAIALVPVIGREPQAIAGKIRQRLVDCESVKEQRVARSKVGRMPDCLSRIDRHAAAANCARVMDSVIEKAAPVRPRPNSLAAERDRAGA